MIPETVIPTNGHFQQFSLTSLLILPRLCIFSCDSAMSFIFCFSSVILQYPLFFVSCDSSMSFIFFLFDFFVTVSTSYFFSPVISQSQYPPVPSCHRSAQSKSLISVKCPFPSPFSMVIMNRQGAFGTFAQQSISGHAVEALCSSCCSHSSIPKVTQSRGRIQTTGEKCHNWMHITMSQALDF